MKTQSTLFTDIKNSTFIQFNLGEGNISLDFFSQFDEEFQLTPSFKNYLSNNKDKSVDSIESYYFLFCQEKFLSLPFDEKVDLFSNQFIQNVSFYKAFSLHSIHSELMADMNKGGLITLFNGEFYARALEIIGRHFQTPVSIDDVKNNINKELPIIMEKYSTINLFKNKNCFAYMKGIDLIFKIRRLKKELNSLKKTML